MIMRFYSTRSGTAYVAIHHHYLFYYIDKQLLIK